MECRDSSGAGNLLELPADVPVNEDQDRILATVFVMCNQLTAKRCRAVVPTNRELAAKYAVSERTVRNWRREGCPFEAGQWKVLDWLSERRYAPAGAKAKFARQLEDRAWRARPDAITSIIDQMKSLKLHYKLNGITVPDWLRGFRCRRRF